MAEISNNMLAGLLIVAIIASVYSIAVIPTGPSPAITGQATGAGKVNLSVNSSVSITLLRNETRFATGFPNLEATGILNIASNSTGNCGDAVATTCFNNGSEGNGSTYGENVTFDGWAHPFVAQIGGNNPATCLRVQATSAAQAFIGGTSPTFKFAGMQNESTLTGSDSDACYGTLANAWTTVSTGWTTVCDTVNHTNTNDEVRIHWELGIPYDAQGDKSNTITVCAAGVCGLC